MEFPKMKANVRCSADGVVVVVVWCGVVWWCDVVWCVCVCGIMVAYCSLSFKLTIKNMYL